MGMMRTVTDGPLGLGLGDGGPPSLYSIECCSRGRDWLLASNHANIGQLRKDGKREEAQGLRHRSDRFACECSTYVCIFLLRPKSS